MKFIPAFLGLIIAALVVAGIVVDGEGKTQTLQQALTIAQSAARSGTNAATGNSVNGDAFNLAAPAAIAAADNYVHDAGATGHAAVAGDKITVTVTMTYLPRILGTFGIPPQHVTATGSATLIDHN